MKKLYCYIASKGGGYDVFEYTKSGNFVFYKNYESEEEAHNKIKELSQ